MKTFLCICLLFISSMAISQSLTAAAQPSATTDTPRIQVAILLDVSGSMDGLIEQAKAQLWSMVETLGKASCNGKRPAIEIALYEYGRSDNPAANHYIKTISPFTSDLDSLSAKLFQLHTNGGDEYCGAVMLQSLNELSWDPNPGYYKVIFIAGNESFRQGRIPWTEACTLAKQKGVIINTIYCGDRQSGIAEFWNLAGECGIGTYTNINQNRKEEDIPTPQDSLIYVLNNRLNESYVGYNSQSAGRVMLQASMDKANHSLSNKTAMKRALVKANGAYNNKSWDLVDAAKADSAVFNHLNREYLPETLKNKTDAEIRTYVKKKSDERTAIQQQINALSAEREKYIRNVQKTTAANGPQNLENAVQQTIKSQAVRYNVQFEE